MDDVLTDSELMERSVADAASFAGLFDRHHGELYRYLRRRARPSPAADTVAGYAGLIAPAAERSLCFQHLPPAEPGT